MSATIRKLLSTVLPGFGIAVLLLGVDQPARADAASDVAAPALAARLAMVPVGAPLQRAMTLESQVADHVVRGTVVGMVERPIGDVRAALRDAAGWCSVLILHVHNRGCSAGGAVGAETIALRVGRKPEQPVEQAYELRFRLRTERSAPDGITARLEAAEGPMGTSDYRIALDAWPAGDKRTLLRLGYSYRQSTVTGWAMDLYLATIGRGKVGFSPAAEGSAKPVGGVRGIVERNLMRYFLAIEAASRMPRVVDEAAYRARLDDWFDETEKYPVQLRELSKERYLALKAPLRAVGVVADAAPP